MGAWSGGNFTTILGLSNYIITEKYGVCSRLQYNCSGYLCPNHGYQAKYPTLKALTEMILSQTQTKSSKKKSQLCGALAIDGRNNPV